MRALRLAATVVSAVAPALAQRGDRADEVQTPLPAHVAVPPAPALAAAEAAATFRLAPGFRVELFAAEPWVGDPITAAFDAAGRLWVVEMRGYMTDLDGSREREPSGRIVVLEDRDGDGRVDTSSTFLAGLVLPRAVLPLRGGALVIAPPELWWCSDADGDLVADGKAVVARGFDAGLDNPEHSGNGLLWGFDHRVHLANDARLLAWTGSGFAIEPGAGGGQWGITHDDCGRVYFNYNEDWLRCDLVPGRYGARGQASGGAATGGLALLNHRVVADRTVWPIRVTPGVNRGYQPGRLIDWVLAIHTAVCAPHVYRGGLLPGCDGDVFVCEPAGNLVRRVVLRDHDGVLAGENAYEAERREFLASTDERFRPVHLLTGLDGALWIVDMYRGVIQHRNFVTTFLRRQIEQRGLAQPTGLGRIWRVVPDSAPAVAPAPARGAEPAAPRTGPRAVPLDRVTLATVVERLADANGAVRDLALRELVQRGDRSAAPALRELLAGAARPAVRIAALSALAGLACLSATELRAALRDPDPGVVAFALQHTGPPLAAGDTHLWLALARHVEHGSPAVRWHVALALGDVLQQPGGARHAAAAANIWRDLLVRDPADARLRGAVGTAAPPAVLVELLPALAAALRDDERSDAVLRDLAARVVRARVPASQERLFAVAAAAEPSVWFRRALLRGAVDALPKGAARAGWLEFAAVPPGLVALAPALSPAPAPAPTVPRAGAPKDIEAASRALAVSSLAHELLAAIALTGVAPAGVVTELAPDEIARVHAGQQTFLRACASCHQLDGNGMQGLAPPLRDSDWVLGPVDRLVRIVLHGVKGPIDVNGTTWTLEMPGQRHLSDDELAGVLAYVRRAFGHRASAVAPAEVAALRAAHRERTEPWSAEELLGSK